MQLAESAFEAGWTLKDATPLNILFVGTRPVLVDVLSFEPRDPQLSIWLAYGQFVRTFLLPLIAEKYLGWPLRATLFSRDGYEPETIYKALQPWQRLHPDLLDVVTLATLLKQKPGKRSNIGSRPSMRRPDPDLITHILKRRVTRLGKQIRRAAKARRSSQWSGYMQTASHYSPADFEQKQRFVQIVLERCRPKRLLDVGANSGTFSRIATESGAEVVAVDNDAAALEALWRMALEQGQSITPLVVNIARPTPAAGWMNREQLSLLDRLTGQFEMVLLLAVIHHLILREQVPLALIGELCAKLTLRWLVVEWVPPSDPMYQEWLRGREELYGHLSEGDLIRAFEPFFHLTDAVDQPSRLVLGNNRVLLLFELHNSRVADSEMSSNG